MPENFIVFSCIATSLFYSVENFAHYILFVYIKKRSEQITGRNSSIVLKVGKNFKNSVCRRCLFCCEEKQISLLACSLVVCSYSNAIALFGLLFFCHLIQNE